MLLLRLAQRSIRNNLAHLSAGNHQQRGDVMFGVGGELLLSCHDPPGRDPVKSTPESSAGFPGTSRSFPPSPSHAGCARWVQRERGPPGPRSWGDPSKRLRGPGTPLLQPLGCIPEHPPRPGLSFPLRTSGDVSAGRCQSRTADCNTPGRRAARPAPGPGWGEAGRTRDPAAAPRTHRAVASAPLRTPGSGQCQKRGTWVCERRPR